MGPDGSYVEETYFGRNRGWDKGYPYKTIGFDAYKIEPQEEEPREEEIKLRHAEGSLDGLALFIGINQSFAIGAAGVPELKLKPDCIYFTDDKEFTPLKWVARMYNYGGHDVGIFDYGSKSLSPCYYSCDYQSIEMAMPAPLWFTPT
ncbi:hypothetical protein PHJA_001475700 [Phtheirospermum japonicum]|uniref:KIB1-4 beta-propeller domain-containing protein n=1 Tax=Phtheirospermum japonicum TaxID=374723 RepID=A0A830CBD2_9LAMI|nr:hypothetical protein PHJA_001475700 [Phtheirospermum japonicum]